MSTLEAALAEDRKLIMEFRLEAGCLGPDGESHIDTFCQRLNEHFAKTDANFMIWKFIPRHDRSLPEKQYKINGKKISREQAHKYLAMFGRDIQKFEDNIDQTLAELINQYLGY